MHTRLALAASLVLPSLLGTGCSTYYNESTTAAAVRTTTTIKFNRRLPDAMEDLFSQCHDPLVIGPDSVGTLGSCEGQSLGAYGDLETQVLALALATEADLDFGSMFPADLTAALQDIHKYDGLPWPVQNCEIFLEMDLGLEGLGLVDLQADWELRNGVPALHIDFDRDTTMPFISGEIDGDVDCPLAWNEPLIQPSLPNGYHEVTVSGVDVDIWILFEVVNEAVRTSVESDVDLGSITLDPPLASTVTDAIGDIDEVLEVATGSSLADFESEANASLAAQLAGLAGTLDDEINDAVDEDGRVDETKIVNNKLHIVTSKPTVWSSTPFQL